MVNLQNFKSRNELKKKKKQKVLTTTYRKEELRMVEYRSQESARDATRSGNMDVNPHQLFTVLAAAELLIITTSVR
jgi:hypothetical protein